MLDRVELSRCSSCVALALVLGCNADATSASGETGDETGDEIDLCESVLDPATYTTPAWSPAPITATPECPALDGPVVLDLATVLVTGVVRMQGEPIAPTKLELRGREDEGIVDVVVAEDGTFGARVLAGRYDVWIGNAPGASVSVERLAIEDADFTSSAELDLDIPPLLSVTATMTMDGEPAPDPYGHIFVSEIGKSSYRHLVGRMDQGMHTIQLAPGEYEFNYTACDPQNDGSIPDYTGPYCYDPELADLPDANYESPDQWVAPIATVVVDQDLQIHLDVPTLRLSGTVSIDGQPVRDYLYSGILSDVGSAFWYDVGPFDERVVVGTYRFHAHEQAPPALEQLVLEQDTHIDVALERHPLSVLFEDASPIVEAENPLLPRLEIRAIGGLDFEAYGLPLPAEELVFAGPHELEYRGYYCWPDYPHDTPVLRRVTQLDVDGPVELDLINLDLAWVRFDYTNLADDDPTVHLQPVSQPGNISLWASEGTLLTHGLMLAGMYEVKGELVEIVDGTTIEIVEESQLIEIDARINGMALSAEDHIDVGERDYPVGGLLSAPGHYPLTYHALGEPSLPENRAAIVGCVTVEG